MTLTREDLTLSELDRGRQLEILGYRDTILGQKATIANLEWRLEEAERKLRVVTRHRDQMARSATWRIGRLAMVMLWPARRFWSFLRRPDSGQKA